MRGRKEGSTELFWKGNCSGRSLLRTRAAQAGPEFIEAVCEKRGPEGSQERLDGPSVGRIDIAHRVNEGAARLAGLLAACFIDIDCIKAAVVNTAVLGC